MDHGNLGPTTRYHTELNSSAMTRTSIIPKITLASQYAKILIPRALSRQN